MRKIDGELRLRVIDGQRVWVLVCEPSKRRAHVKPYPSRPFARDFPQAANWLAKDRGLKP